MLLTRQYDQRPFDKTVCDAIIANGGVKPRQKMCKIFVMTDVSNTVQILVACVMQGIRFSSINCLRWGWTKEMVCQTKACAMYSIWFTRMNCLRFMNSSLMGYCRCQNRRISGRGSRTVHLGSMLTRDRGHDVYPGSGPLYGGNTCWGT